jgi:drug/metabolite transporter, DME family
MRRKFQVRFCRRAAVVRWSLSLTLAPVSDVVLIVGLSPLIGLGVKAFAGKPVTAIESIGAVTAFGGLVLFVLPKLQGHHSDLTAYLMGLSFALFSAAISLSYASLFKSYAMTQPLLNPVPVAFLTFAIGVEFGLLK